MPQHKNVTLYVPCYNAERYIAECLEGILRQTYPIDEILIIDDGSTDKTVEIASKYHVKIIRHGANKGLAAARNTAFRNAKNEFVAALDADCVPEPDWLEKLMENFTNENIAGVGGKLIEKYVNTLADKWRAVHLHQHWGDERIVNPPFLAGCNNVFRKRAVEEVGFYDERLRTNGEDTYIGKKLKEKGFVLVYDPISIAKHLKKDTILSVLNAMWRYHNSNRPTIDIKILFQKIKFFLLKMFEFVLYDFKNKNFALIFIDFIFPFHNFIIAFSEYIQKKYGEINELLYRL